MTRSDFCRLIVDPQPSPGCWNMAIDEALLESSLAENVCSVRCYGWSEPTLSLGYFQDSAAGTGSRLLDGLPRVRRLSGGGAILHDHEWTYSCALAPEHPLAKAPDRLYQMVHERVIDMLRSRGVAARLRGAGSAAAGDEFLCFSRADPKDVVLSNRKILGSAQRRRRGAVLQHGSLLLRASRQAPQFPGILDECPDADVDAQFPVQLVQEIGAMLGCSGRMVSLPERVGRRALALQRDRYRRLVWRTGHVASPCQDRLRSRLPTDLPV